jgi:RNA polymerase sigma-70 factor (ECF subfamily)
MSLAAALAFADGGMIPGIDLSMADDSLPAGSRSREDSALVRRIRQGDSERFAKLIERYQRHVGRIVGRRVPADRVAELVHDVFVRAYVNLPQFSDSVPFEHWLAGIAVRTCYDFWRRRTRDEVPASALSDDHQHWIEKTLSAASEREFHDQAAKREAADVLEWALGQLSPEQRAVLTIVHLDGYSVREAAQLLGWTVINVKVRAYRARRALRAILCDNVAGGSHDASR